MSTLTPPLEILPEPESAIPVQPCTLVIFGGSGDLARRRLIPALYNLLLDGLLPSRIRRHRVGPKIPHRSGFSSDCAGRSDRPLPTTPRRSDVARV